MSTSTNEDPHLCFRDKNGEGWEKVWKVFGRGRRKIKGMDYEIKD